MSIVLVAGALVVASGSIAALASSDARLGLVGLAAALVAAGLVADPLPGPAILGVRLTAALLAVAVLRASGSDAAPRRRVTEPGPDRLAHLGWPAEGLLFVAAALAGLAFAADLATFAPVTGPVTSAGLVLGGWTVSLSSLALGLACGLGAIALPALVAGAGLRRATAAVLAVQGAVLARVALAGPPDILEEIVLGGLVVTVAAAAALLAAAGRAGREGRTGQDDEPRQLERGPGRLEVGRQA